jgi:hypothetical protein
MIRKSTWILVVIFIVLLGGTLYLQKNPLPEKDAEVTPSPTPQPRLLGEWQSSDIQWIAVQRGEGEAVTIAQDGSGNWIINADATAAADAGKVEAVRSEIAGALIQAALPADYDRSALGLDQPVAIITLKNQTAEEVIIQVGNETPTGSGYYVTVGQGAPVAVDQGAIDAVLEQVTLENLLPEATATPMELQPSMAP